MFNFKSYPRLANSCYCCVCVKIWHKIKNCKLICIENKKNNIRKLSVRSKRNNDFNIVGQQFCKAG